MSLVPDNLHYTKTHEWVTVEADGIALVGVTDHAQAMLGELVFVELPTTGQQVNSGEEVVVVESVKAASDVYSPCAGEITEVNSKLESAPEKVNESPYEEGWLFRIKFEDKSQLDKLLSAQAYQKEIDGECD